MDRRPDVPDKIATALLIANDHTCCICSEPRRAVQIHHIDGDSSNNNPSNLAVLCLDCHSRVTGHSGFGRRYSAEEVRGFKQRWEALCASPTTHEVHRPVQVAHEVTRVAAEEHKLYRFHLNEGDQLVIVVSSDESIDLSICSPADYRRWASEEEELTEFEGAERVLEWEYSFTAPRTGTYCFLIINEGTDEAEIEVDVAVWEAA
jgi:HNH endonuclease